MARLPLLALVVLLIIGGTIALNDVVVYNLKLFVNGNEFIIKGFNYQPAPIGYVSKTGLCSPRQLPWLGETDTACYDSDYFDGSKDVNRQPVAGPQNGWFRALWERDLPVMKLMGANAIRLFNTNPTTLAATQWVVANKPGLYNITQPFGKEHLSFMDYADSLGLKVVFPLFSDAASLRTMDKDQLYWLVKNQVDEIGNHPALLMYQMGNELTLRNKDYLTLYNTAADLINFARSYQLQKWNRNIPFTTAMLDVEGTFEEAMRSMPIDLLMANSGYRSTNCAHPNCAYDFGDLWSGTPGGFQGMYKLSCQYQQPVVIGEMNPIGWHDIDESMQLPGAFNTLWADLLKHIDQGAVGGFFFEFTDEPWKASVQQARLGVMQISVNCQNGQCSDQPNVWLADTATQRGWVYNAICCGTYQGLPYNFQTDPFTLLGRPPATLATATNPCPAGSYTPKPSGGDITVALASTTALATSSVASTTSVVAAATTSSAATTSAATTSAASTSAATTAAATTSAASTSEAASQAVTTSTASTSTTADASTTTTVAVTTSTSATVVASTNAVTTTAAASTAALTTLGASVTSSMSATATTSVRATTSDAATGRIRFDHSAASAVSARVAFIAVSVALAVIAL